ncbi:MAG: VPLPA-CTERM sorting domain-containing protein [Pseudomonadota bacterium]
MTMKTTTAAFSAALLLCVPSAQAASFNIFASGYDSISQTEDLFTTFDTGDPSGDLSDATGARFTANIDSDLSGLNVEERLDNGALSFAYDLAGPPFINLEIDDGGEIFFFGEINTDDNNISGSFLLELIDNASVPELGSLAAGSYDVLGFSLEEFDVTRGTFIEILSFFAFDQSFFELVSGNAPQELPDIAGQQLLGTYLVIQEFDQDEGENAGPVDEPFAVADANFASASITPAEIPLPGALPLMLAGLAGFVVLRRRNA